jgi:hypothetical protein
LLREREFCEVIHSRNKPRRRRRHDCAKSRRGYSAARCTGSRTPAPRRRHAPSDLRAAVRIGLGFEVRDCVRVGAVRGGEHR